MQHQHIKKSESKLNSNLDHNNVKHGHSESFDMKSMGMPLYLQRQPVEEEEEELQPKLKVGAPNDKYEQEADRVADEVMRMPDSKIQRQIESEEEEETIQTKSISTKPIAVTTGLKKKIQSLKSGGQSLHDSERTFFEPRFGVDFNQVRVHSDHNAALIAQSINARAFTHGRDVVFGSGEYSPGASSGRKLLAHELTHVVQQNTQNTIRRVITEEEDEGSEFEDESSQLEDEGSQLEDEGSGCVDEDSEPESHARVVGLRRRGGIVPALRFRLSDRNVRGLPDMGIMVEVSAVPGTATPATRAAGGFELDVFPRSAATVDVTRNTRFVSRAVIEGSIHAGELFGGLPVRLYGRLFVWERGNIDNLHIAQARLRIYGRLRADDLENINFWLGHRAAQWCRSLGAHLQVNIQVEFSFNQQDYAALRRHHRALQAVRRANRALDAERQVANRISRLRTTASRGSGYSRRLQQSIARQRQLSQDLIRAERLEREALSEVPERLRGMGNGMRRSMLRQLGAATLRRVGQVLAGFGIVSDLIELAGHIWGLSTGREIIDPSRAGETTSRADTPGEEGEAAGSHEQEGEGEDSSEMVHVESAEVDTGGGASEGHIGEHEESGTSTEQLEAGAEASTEGTTTEAIEQPEQPGEAEASTEAALPSSDVAGHAASSEMGEIEGIESSEPVEGMIAQPPEESSVQGGGEITVSEEEALEDEQIASNPIGRWVAQAAQTLRTTGSSFHFHVARQITLRERQIHVGTPISGGVAFILRAHGETRVLGNPAVEVSVVAIDQAGRITAISIPAFRAYDTGGEYVMTTTTIDRLNMTQPAVYRSE